MSKQTKLTLPPSTTFGGEIQEILSELSRFKENWIPSENAAANWGGQLIVIKSKNEKRNTDEKLVIFILNLCIEVGNIFKRCGEYKE